jgi:hypothetical protein
LHFGALLPSATSLPLDTTLRVGSDERDRKAVVSLTTHGLDRRGAHARLSGEQFVEAAHPLDVGIAAGGVDHRSVAHDIVGDDQAATTGELERPCEVIRIARLVGVDEDQVKWTATLGGELRQRIQCRRRSSTTWVRPARAMLARATSACFGSASKVIRRPSAGSARASQIVL